MNEETTLREILAAEFRSLQEKGVSLKTIRDTLHFEVDEAYWEARKVAENPTHFVDREILRWQIEAPPLEIDGAKAVWDRLSAALPHLPEPEVCGLGDGDFQFHWQVEGEPCWFDIDFAVDGPPHPTCRVVGRRFRESPPCGGKLERSVGWAIHEGGIPDAILEELLQLYPK